MKKILLMLLLFFIFPGNIIVQSIAMAGIFIVITQSIKKRAKNYPRKLNDPTKDIISEKTIESNENKREINYLYELKTVLDKNETIEKPKIYQKK